jgi:hypothetical protein
MTEVVTSAAKAAQRKFAPLPRVRQVRFARLSATPGSAFESVSRK